MTEAAFSVVALTPQFAPGWRRMRHALYEDGDPEELDREAKEIERTRIARGMPYAVFVGVAGGEPMGFAEGGIRPIAEGCEHHPVGYLEGWYVRPEWRRRGVGRALVDAVESWAARQGCREIASDTADSNDAGAGAHRAIGFEQVGVVRCFVRPIREQRRENAR